MASSTPNAMPNAQTIAQHSPLLHADRNGQKQHSWGWARFKGLLAIFLSLLVELAFALGHHFMNAQLDGRPVDSISVPQSWIFRFGTAFAFLVKVGFAVSVAASYVQYQWLKFRRRSFRVGEIDCLTDIFDNVMQFVYTPVFLYQPTLLLMAIVIWITPFAAVVTPGSLTVEPSRATSIIQSNVPELAFKGSKFANVTNNNDNVLSSTALVYKLAYNAAAAGRPVVLSSRFSSETYSVAFHGPAVQCPPTSDSLIRSLFIEYDTNQLAGIAIQYVSWVPWETFTAKRLLGLHPPILTSTPDETNDTVARIYILTNTGSWAETIPYVVTSNYTNHTYHRHAVKLNVTECQLYNTTYNVDFSFQYPNQTSKVTSLQWLNPVRPPTADLGHYETPVLDTTQETRLAYLSLMQAFGKLLVGYSTTNPSNPTTLATYTSWHIMDIDWSQGIAVQRGLESLFQNLTLSLLSAPDFLKSTSDTEPIPQTVTTFPVTYVYASWELLMPYGLAFFFALLCAIIGTYASFVNGATYHNSFSSFLRATAGHDIHASLNSNRDAADPLPPDLAKFRINMGTTDGKHE